MIKQLQFAPIVQTKRIIELGIDKELFEEVWWYIPKKDGVIISSKNLNSDYEYVCPAISVAELGEMLNFDYDAYGFTCCFFSYANTNPFTASYGGNWSVGYRNPSKFENPNIKAETEGEARALMLIFVLENNIAKAEDINEHLRSLK